MFVSIPQMNVSSNVAKIKNPQMNLDKNYSFQKTFEKSVLPQTIIEELVDGILMITEEGALTYANDCAQRIFRQLNQGESLSCIPKELWHICRMLIESRHLFPNQYWLIESKVFVGSSIAFNVRARWLKLKNMECSCILLNIRDRYQDIKDMVNEESQKYGLTSREKEV